MAGFLRQRKLIVRQVKMIEPNRVMVLRNQGIAHDRGLSGSVGVSGNAFSSIKRWFYRNLCAAKRGNPTGRMAAAPAVLRQR
ncbi:hypothetical protein [Rhizobium leguminosarum]|uniref:Uncharacterized protein n=1 Tax=Rhizobium leguminosarum TaxID=384 RepID=A0A7K3VPV8_RHILE|nr:hypothetical protein [Rhizobium leguminosarum]MBY2950690.1 hypothetical protein [Rhizobium leguminosarum]NEK19220.1 hypothetical protein [Rhizobium leguminosarum]